MAHNRFSSRQGNINCFRLNLVFQRPGFQFFHFRFQMVFNNAPRRIDELPHFRPFFFGKAFQFFHNRRQFAFFAQILDTYILHVLQCFTFCDLFVYGCFNSLNFIAYHLSVPPLIKKDFRPLVQGRKSDFAVPP